MKIVKIETHTKIREIYAQRNDTRFRSTTKTFSKYNTNTKVSQPFLHIKLKQQRIS